MLWDISREKEIVDIPHKNEYNIWISRLSLEELDSIKTEILNKIHGDEIATAGWIPGSDWTDTPYQPIYEKACHNDEEQSGKCFGLIVWVTLMEHPDYWSFGRYELNSIPIQSMTYFKVHPRS